MAAPKTYKSFERDNRTFVTGISSIDHKIRLMNNLTFKEYVILVTIMSFREGSAKDKGITYGNFWIASGIKPDHVKRAYETLKAKGLLFKDDNGLIQVAEKFYRDFTSGSNFEEFWLIQPKGSKIGAKKMYDRALKIKKHAELCKKYREYLAFCDENKRFKKDTSSWLNPTMGYIETDWIGEQKKTEEVKTNEIDDFLK